MQRFRNRSGHMRIVNGYGPTGTTVCATLFLFGAATEPDRRTPIGTGIRGYEVYLLDANMQLVPIGIPGKLLYRRGWSRTGIYQPSGAQRRAVHASPLHAMSRELASTKPEIWPVSCPMESGIPWSSRSASEDPRFSR